MARRLPYKQNSFGEAVGVSDQQIIDAFESNTPGLREALGLYMQHTGKSNIDLLDMVKSYYPETQITIADVGKFTGITNNPYGGGILSEQPVNIGGMGRIGAAISGALAPGANQKLDGLIQPFNAPPVTGRETRPQKGDSQFGSGGPINPTSGRAGMPTKFDETPRFQATQDMLRVLLDDRAQRPGKFDGVLRGNLPATMAGT